MKKVSRSRGVSRGTPLEAERSCQVCALLMLLASELFQRYLSLLWSRAFRLKSPPGKMLSVVSIK